jgi:hypothetical protein
MQEPGEVGAGRHTHAGEGFFDGAGSADACAALENENALAGAREIGGAGEAIVTRADDDCVPRSAGEFTDGSGKSDFTENGGGGR